MPKKITSFLSELEEFSEAAKTYAVGRIFLRLLVRKNRLFKLCRNIKKMPNKKANIRALFYKAECFEKRLTKEFSIFCGLLTI
ncbi:MAG: hypothetical protein L6V93_07480 [Clostridiales bacterium]|nr:MAG: hypothetical protein L6V93_07480 [Clostridiales bacterium]